MGVLNIMRLGRAGLARRRRYGAALSAAPPPRNRPSSSRSTGSSKARPRRSWSPIDKGYYKAEGLDVTIDTAGGSLEPLNRVASGTYDMGFGDINSLIKFRDANPNVPIKAMFMVYNKPAFSIVSRKSRGVIKPKDLEGKKLGAPAPDGAFAQWKIFTAGQQHRRLQGHDRERRLPGARADAGRTARSTPSPASRSRPTST